MNDKEELRLVFCDQEQEYAHLLSNFLRERKGIAWEIQTYTNMETMLEKERNKQIDIMMVAERSFEQVVEELHPRKTIILTECGLLHDDEYMHVDKYQEAQNVYKSLVEICIQLGDARVSFVTRHTNTVFIGIYSPIRRCFQTTFAVTLGNMIAQKYKTLYLNFEHFSGISELAADVGARDLADLLYFLMAEKEKFFLRLQTVVKHNGNLDYVPPMKCGQNMLSISSKEWEKLLLTIDESGQYQYVIMDLSESMQGLFDILRMCTKVFTLTKEDRIAQGKLAEYERILQNYSYEDVLEKTQRCMAPVVRKVPETLDQYTKGEFADYIKNIINEIERTKDNGLH